MIHWPPPLIPRNAGTYKRARSVSGSSSLRGATQNILSDAGLWVAEPSSFPVCTPDLIKLWRAMEGIINGRANSFLFPIYEGDRRPSPTGDTLSFHSDDAGFSDGTGYWQPNYTATVGAAAAAGATTIRIDYPSGHDRPEPGHIFSIGDHLYSIVTRNSASATTTSVTIFPPLRKAIAVGEAVNFTTPVLKARLASDEEMDLGLADNRYGFPSIRMIEDTTP